MWEVLGLRTATTSISISSGNKEVIPLDGNMVRGCPGKRLLSLAILPDVEPLAWDALWVKLEEYLERDCRCKLDTDEPLCMKSKEILSRKEFSTRIYFLLLYIGSIWKIWREPPSMSIIAQWPPKLEFQYRETTPRPSFTSWIDTTFKYAQSEKYISWIVAILFYICYMASLAILYHCNDGIEIGLW